MMESKLTLLLLLAAGHSVHGEAGIDLVSFGDLYKLAQGGRGVSTPGDEEREQRSLLNTYPFNQGTTGRQGYTATNQGFSSVQSLAGQGFGGQQGYTFGQGGFAAGQGGYDVGQGIFASNQGGFATGQGGFAASQEGLASSQGGFAASQGGYAAGQGGFAAGQGGYAASQGGYAAGLGGYAASQGGYAAGQGGFAAAGQSTLTGLQGYSGGIAGVRPAGTAKLDVFNLGGFQFGDFGGSTQVQAAPALAQTAAGLNAASLGYAAAAAVPEITVGQVYGAGPVVQEPAVQAVYEASAVQPVLQHNEHHFQPGHDAVEQYNPLARGAVHAAAVPAVQAVPAVHASVAQSAVHAVHPGRNQLDYNVLAFQNPHRARKPALGLEPRPVLETVAVAEERCIDKIEHVEETEYDEIEECHHSYDKKCHTSYSTEYSSQQEVECEDNYKKSCDITYSPSAHNETVHVCSRPLIKDCNLPGPPECRTEYISECWTKEELHTVVDDVPHCETVYDEKCHAEQSGYSTEEKCSKWPREVCSVKKQLKKKATPKTKCEKVPQKLCGPSGCGFVPGPEVCIEKTKTIITDLPSESCNLDPKTTCEHVTKLVPKLVPVEECVDVPKEICNKVKGPPKTVLKPVTKKWCYTPTLESGLH